MTDIYTPKVGEHETWIRQGCVQICLCSLIPLTASSYVLFCKVEMVTLASQSGG